MHRLLNALIILIYHLSSSCTVRLFLWSTIICLLSLSRFSSSLTLVVFFMWFTSQSFFFYFDLCLFTRRFFPTREKKIEGKQQQKTKWFKNRRKKVKIQMKIQFSVVTFFNNRQAMLSENSTQIRSEIAMKTSILLFHAKLFKSIYHQCEKESICRSSFLSN